MVKGTFPSGIIVSLLAILAAADAARAASPGIRVDRHAICAFFEQAGHKDCVHYEIVRSNRSAEVLLPAILSGAMRSAPILRGGSEPANQATNPVKR